MLQYFTGSQQHNIRLRDFANRMGLSLNEYGITNIESGQVEVFPDEESFYARLGLPWIPPELRAGMWELDAAQEGRLPQLVESSHLRGDLHLHSEWSDGSDPIETMVATVASLGYEYMALTDHSQGLGVANGLTPERLAAQRDVLRQLQERFDIRILAGSEVDIRSDGRMDFPDEVLAELDVVVASVHNAMSQDRETMTRRIIRAMEHPSVTIIGHLTTRLLGQRPPTDFDLEAVLQAARDTGTALEINASPERLDLRDTHAFRARELGIPLVISTDSHHHSQLSGGRFGVAVARRAWCEPRHILNTMPRDEFLRFIRTPKPERIQVFDAVVAAASPASLHSQPALPVGLLMPRAKVASASKRPVSSPADTDIEDGNSESQEGLSPEDVYPTVPRPVGGRSYLVPGSVGGHGPVDTRRRVVQGPPVQVHGGRRGIRLAAPCRASVRRSFRLHPGARP